MNPIRTLKTDIKTVTDCLFVEKNPIFTAIVFVHVCSWAILMWPFHSTITLFGLGIEQAQFIILAYYGIAYVILYPWAKKNRKSRDDAFLSLAIPIVIVLLGISAIRMLMVNA